MCHSLFWKSLHYNFSKKRSKFKIWERMDIWIKEDSLDINGRPKKAHFTIVTITIEWSKWGLETTPPQPPRAHYITLPYIQWYKWNYNWLGLSFTKYGSIMSWYYYYYYYYFLSNLLFTVFHFGWVSSSLLFSHVFLF